MEEQSMTKPKNLNKTDSETDSEIIVVIIIVIIVIIISTISNIAIILNTSLAFAIICVARVGRRATLVSTE